jgi:3-oxo-4-pregnene-20-carboxyl-CoA dehydrogenase alpha subunit
VDFTPGVAEAAASELAAQVIGGGTGNDRLWKELGSAGLLSLAVPAEFGGDGLGMQATAAVLTEVGRHAAEVPALSTLALGVLPVAQSADPAVKQQLLAGVASGDTVLTAAIREPSHPMPAVPETTVTAGAISGVKVGVPDAAAARWILVPGSLDDGGTGQTARTIVAVVERGSSGVTCQRTRSSSGRPEYTVRLDDAPVRFVLDGCDPAAIYQFAIAGVCAVADGVLAAALEMTTEHVRTRQQFGRPLAAFQAVAQQIADVYAAARTVHLATVSACWRLDPADLDVAAYWLARYGPPALRTCHQLHGGLGMDVTYPLPRYSALMTDLVAMLGGAEYQLDRLAAGESAGESASA